jgi:hypothetical protein
VIRKYSTYSRLQNKNKKKKQQHNLICSGGTEFQIPKTFKLIMTEIKPVHEETYFKFKFHIDFQLTDTAIRSKCVHIQFKNLFLGNVCYLVQKLLSSHMHATTVKIHLYKDHFTGCSL